MFYTLDVHNVYTCVNCISIKKKTQEPFKCPSVRLISKSHFVHTRVSFMATEQHGVVSWPPAAVVGGAL